jgi:hypothetical protein
MIADFSTTFGRVFVPAAVLAAFTLLRKYLPEPDVDRNLLEFIREKTALPVESAQTEADLTNSFLPR